MTWIGIIALALVLLSLTLTLLFQFRPFSTRAMRLDLLGLVPRWRFFAQDLGQVDFEIELCALPGDGHSGAGDDGPWHVVWQSAARRWRDALWNPESYRWAAIWCAGAMLERRVAAGGVVDERVSLAYRRVLNQARRGLAPGAGAFRFALVRSDSGARRRVFMSPVHRA